MKARNIALSSAVLVAVTLLAAPARAQEAPPLTPGQRLRITAAIPGRFTGVTVGSLVKVGPDSLTLVDPERGAVTELPLSSIQRLEVSQGRRRRTRQGLLIGAAVGIAFAPLLWTAMSEDPQACGGYYPNPPRACNTGEKAGFVTFGIGFYSGLGAWLGHRKQSEDWSDSPVERLRVTVRPERGGGRIAVAFSF